MVLQLIIRVDFLGSCYTYFWRHFNTVP